MAIAELADKVTSVTMNIATIGALAQVHYDIPIQRQGSAEVNTHFLYFVTSKCGMAGQDH